MHYGFDVLVGSRRFLVEKLPLLADDPSAQGSSGQLRNTEAFAHAQAAFASGPLSPGTVSQRPGMAFAVTGYLHEVAERTPGSGNDSEVAVSLHRTLAVGPGTRHGGLESTFRRRRDA